MAKKIVSFRFSQETLSKLDEVVRLRNQVVADYNIQHPPDYRLERWTRTSLLEFLIQKEFKDNSSKLDVLEDLLKE